MAQYTAMVPGGIPLDEYTKTAPPGWKEDIGTYPSRLHLEKLKFWDGLTDATDTEKPVLIIGRRQGDAYKMAAGVRRPRVQAVEETGVMVPKVVILMENDAICAPSSVEVRDAVGQLVLGAQNSGLHVAIETVKSGLSRMNRMKELSPWRTSSSSKDTK